MSGNFEQDTIRAATAYFDSSLERYGRARLAKVDSPSEDRVRYVGQFIDGEGIAGKQYGIYGMGAWLVLSKTSQAGITRLREACKEGLIKWTTESKTPDPPVDSNAYELRFITPKICYAYSGLMAAQAEESARILLNHITNARTAPHGWGMLTSSPEADPSVTAMVVRAFREDQQFAGQLTDALKYLRDQYETQNNICLRLYILNTIAIADALNTQLNEFKPVDLIKKEISALQDAVRRDPLSLANPVTLHFADDPGTRLRYLRFPGDLILLESLLLASGPVVRYFASPLGTQIWKRLHGMLSGPNYLSIDTCGDRTSLSTCLHVRDVLQLLTEKIAQNHRGVLAWGFSQLAFLYRFERRLLLQWSTVLLLLLAMLASTCWLSQSVRDSVFGSLITYFVVAVIDTYFSVVRDRSKE